MVLDSRETFILAVLVLFTGKWLNKKIGFLREYNIPEPVTGGVLASLVFGAIYFGSGIAAEFSLHQRDAHLLVFFTTIGLSSRFSTLLKGGRALLILLFAAVAYLFIQNITGVTITSLTGLDRSMGVLGGSVSLSGGHGTAIAWAPLFRDDYGIPNAMEVGIACARFGLVLGGVIGGPIAQFLIKRYNLKPAKAEEEITVGFAHDEQPIINVDSMLKVLLIISIAIGLGLQGHKLLETVGFQLPSFVTCLFAGIIITNTVPLLFKRVKWITGTPTLALVSDLSLSLFLAMSLMSLQLWTLIDLALPIILLLFAQVVVISLFSIFVIFRVLGKDFDAAVISSGYAGLALGATPTAIANMTAVTQKFGPAPKAFIVIPLVGAFFIDIANALVIKTVLSWVT